MDIPAVLKQSRDRQLRFRDGELELTAVNVALLENATVAETGNADLWYGMGAAYVNLAARATMPEALRNRANEAEDLDYLIEKAEWNRAGNFMTILMCHGREPSSA